MDRSLHLLYVLLPAIVSYNRTCRKVSCRRAVEWDRGHRVEPVGRAHARGDAMIDLTTVSTEGKSDGNASSEQVARIRDLCDEIERIYESGDRYPKITVTRHWSKHNPTISGEIARPTAFCAGSARTGERTLRVSVDAALRAGIFKASGSFDPMGWSVGARRSFPRP